MSYTGLDITENSRFLTNLKHCLNLMDAWLDFYLNVLVVYMYVGFNLILLWVLGLSKMVNTPISLLLPNSNT